MYDLHIHSFYSNDGEFSPEQLVENCNICSIKVMSITDHNTVAANFTAQKSAVKHNIKYIPGIEIDCTFENTDFHVLGYQINFQDPAFAEIENNIRTQSMTISQIRLEKIKKLGLAISETELNALSKDNGKKEEAPKVTKTGVPVVKPNIAGYYMKGFKYGTALAKTIIPNTINLYLSFTDYNKLLDHYESEIKKIRNYMVLQRKALIAKTKGK